jgi:hypothetical protein
MFFHNLEKHLLPESGAISEFLFYTALVRNHPDYINFNEVQKHFTLWAHYNKHGSEHIKKMFYDELPKVSVMGITKGISDNPENKKWLNEWLKKRGFEFRYN